MEKNPQKTPAELHLGPNARVDRPVAFFNIPGERCLKIPAQVEQQLMMLRDDDVAGSHKSMLAVHVAQALVQRAINVLDFIDVCIDVADELEMINTKLKLRMRC